jgi:drug/metabolite transporter (DMT)-like permease
MLEVMFGVVYLMLALVSWTVWAVLSARLGCRLSPLNSLLWTGLASAVITFGGFLVHCRQLQVPTGKEWLLMGIFCAANTLACFGYYAALRHLPGSLVLPVSHLYLVFGPLLIGFLEKRGLSWVQLTSLCVIALGTMVFLAATPATEKTPAVAEVKAVPDSSGAQGEDWPSLVNARATVREM